MSFLLVPGSSPPATWAPSILGRGDSAGGGAAALLSEIEAARDCRFNEKIAAKE